MSATTEAPPVSTGEPSPPPGSSPRNGWASAGWLALGIGIVVVGALLFGRVFEFLKDEDANRGLVVLVAILVGVFGVFALYWAMNRVVDAFPVTWREHIRPWVFVGPALVILTVFLVYPVINTILISLKDARGEEFVGIDNFRFLFSDPSMLRAMRNTAGWMILVPIAAVSIGLAFATLADRLFRGEAIAKSMIFLPMAISFAGAAVTWRLIYAFRPSGFGSNIGLLNGILLAFNQEPVPWLQQQPWNNLLLMVIMVWMQTGFAMVVLSAAIKSIPDEILEAARLDGATEFQVFRKIIIPSILPTIVVVTTYMVINALKVFDIVFVIGSAETNGTEVVAERMLDWFFIANHDGRGAAIAVLLFVAVVPVMLWNVRRFREQELTR